MGLLVRNVYKVLAKNATRNQSSLVQECQRRNANKSPEKNVHRFPDSLAKRFLEKNAEVCQGRNVLMCPSWSVCRCQGKYVHPTLNALFVLRNQQQPLHMWHQQPLLTRHQQP